MGSIPNPASSQEQSLPLEKVDVAIIGGRHVSSNTGGYGIS
jgi:hypothetical protein